jgi:peptide/nickel transport system substrate-binding protein
MTKTAELTDLNLFSAPISGYSLVYLNHQNPNTPFFKDANVRKALMHALDRQKLIDTVLKGQGMVADSPIMPYSWAYDPDITKYGYDPEAARQLLDQAGWVDSDGDGVRDREGVKLAFVLLGKDKAKLDAISAMWAEIGVKAEPQAVSLPGLTADFLAPRTFDAALVDWELSGDPDPYPLWHSTQAKTGQNYAGWESRRADEAIERARSLPDHESRIPFYKDFQRIFNEEVPSLLLYYPVYTYGVRNKVRDAQMGPLNTPGDRYRSIANWYIVTKRVTVGSAGAQRTAVPQPTRAAEQTPAQLDTSGK